MHSLSDAELYDYIREDLPYFDLTTHMLDLPVQNATLRILTRETVIVACSEEAARIAQLLGCHVESYLPSKSSVEAGSVLLVMHGSHDSLHQAWKLCQVLLEYACAMATRAHAMLQRARSVNEPCEILVTRKSYPFAKKFAIRALLCGGVLPHRLGLSESVLIFNQHRALYQDTATFKKAMQELKSRCIEKKLVIESETLEDAKAMLALGADVIQMDKATPQTLHELVCFKDEHFPHAKIIAAGKINTDNVVSFAQTGVNGIVTSHLYSAGMSDLTAQWSGI